MILLFFKLHNATTDMEIPITNIAWKPDPTKLLNSIIKRFHSYI